MVEDLAVGSIVDRRYELRRELRRDASTAVFEALHRFTGRRAAIKLLVDDDPELRAQLFREATAFAEERHPNIVEVVDAGKDELGRAYLVTEMIEGRSLEVVLAARRALAPALVVAIGVGVSDALAYAHARSIVHGDVRSMHVYVDEREAAPSVKIADFAFGAGDAPDAHADVRALATMLFECLTGAVPQTPSSPAQSRPAAALLRAREVPQALADAVERGLSADPARRFGDATAFGDTLRQLGLAPAAPPSKKPEQRRQFARAPYATPVRILRPDGSAVDGRSEDVSEGGLLLLVARPPADAEHVRVRFALPITDEIVTLAGHVRWVRAARDGKGAVGFELDDPPEAVRKNIASYVVLMGPRPD